MIDAALFDNSVNEAYIAMLKGVSESKAPYTINALIHIIKHGTYYEI
jgi:hypothetical protein